METKGLLQRRDALSESHGPLGQGIGPAQFRDRQPLAGEVGPHTVDEGRARQIPDHRSSTVATQHSQGGEASEVLEPVGQLREQLTSYVADQRLLASDVALEAVT